MSTTVTGASGTTYISGSGSSGFDSSTLIKEAVEAKMAPAYSLDTQIEALNTELAGWQEMQTDLESLYDAAEALSSQADDNVFDERAAYLTSSSVSSPEDVLAVTVDNEADLGVYEIEVKNLATSHKVASSEVEDSSAELGYTGTFTLQQDGDTAQEISVTSDMSLSDLVDAINDVSSTSGVAATLMKTADEGYTLLLTSTDTGKSITVEDTSDTGDTSIMQTLGVLSSDGSYANELQAASDAELTIDGVTVTSSSNDIEDLMPGVSISLYDECEGDTITLKVGQSLDDVATAITNLVDAYNTYRTFALTNQETDEDGASDDAALFGESTLRSANTAIYEALRTSVEVDGETYTLADIGISYDDDNKLEVDDDTLEEMLIQNPDVIQAFLQQSTTISDDDLYGAEISSGMSSGDYTIDITTDSDGNITAASINGTALEVDDKTLTGADGTAYEGMRLVYTGSGDASITMKVSAGLTDMLTAALDTYTNDTDGLLDGEIDSLNDMIDSKQEDRDRIAEQADEYEDYLVSYYAKIEAEIEASEVALAQVEALFNSDSD